MKLTLLGTGVSMGVPEINCTCEVCKSTDPRDKRMRTSAYLQTDTGESILLDCGPDFYHQALRTHIPHLHAVLITHEHYDHVGGIEDLRPFSRYPHNPNHLPLYCDRKTLFSIKERLPYLFREQLYTGVPSVVLNEIQPYMPFLIGKTEIMPLLVEHGELHILGFRTGRLAYITDCSRLPDKSINHLQGVTHLVLNALHFKPHEAHFNVEQACALVANIKERFGTLQETYLIHFTHRIGLYKETSRLLPNGIFLGYDGLEITIPD